MTPDWQRFKQLFHHWDSLDLSLDLSRMELADDYLAAMAPRMQAALAEMAALEAGAIANRDEQRQVGHYWLRAPQRAPSPEIATAITTCNKALQAFSRRVHDGSLRGQTGQAFTDFLVIGIGGSALGAQFVARALGGPRRDRMNPHFIDNTDPDGMLRVFDGLGNRLASTLCVAVSKSGGTKEIWNGLHLAGAAFAEAGLVLDRQAIAVTATGSNLDRHAKEADWLESFPMWDWVGGRTSVLSAAGLVPAALQGIDIDGLLAGAARMDAATRAEAIADNPAALLALAWYAAGDGQGRKNMVVLPYKDRLELFGRYLQQLVMESLGKAHDRQGKPVAQGISVFGNKGSTDQHAYVQQLREGRNDFFVSFIEVLRDGYRPTPTVESDVTAGDYLDAFYLGTREALSENGRISLTLTLAEISPIAIGGLIALFERAVGLYASLIDVNAYNQPGVEAGKKAAAAVLALQSRVLAALAAARGEALGVEDIAAAAGLEPRTETVFKVLQHLATNPEHGVKQLPVAGESIFAARYRLG